MTLNLTKCAIAVTLGLFTSESLAQDTTALKTEKEKESYAVAVDLARNLKRRGVQMEPEAFIRGIRDVISGQKLLLSEEELGSTLRMAQVGEKQRRVMRPDNAAGIAGDNAAQGAAFLAQNKTNQGVVCLPSGLQYKILKAGNGQKPQASDTIECRFRATLIDGGQFAGTAPDGPPATLKISDLVPGLREGLALMPVGSKWQFFIPPQLAYGDKGVGRSRYAQAVGPNTTLIYEVELLGIK